MELKRVIYCDAQKCLLLRELTGKLNNHNLLDMKKRVKLKSKRVFSFSRFVVINIFFSLIQNLAANSENLSDWTMNPHIHTYVTSRPSFSLFFSPNEEKEAERGKRILQRTTNHLHITKSEREKKNF